MQDRLKSRVWEPQEKVMHYNDFVLTSTGYVAKCENLPEVANKNGVKLNDGVFLINQTNLEFDKKMLVMQCTGLKDKNGKLIFEGDICEYEFDDIGKQKAIIYFNKKYASFMVKPTDNFQYAKINDCEVIGNIYENPELIGGAE